MHLVHSRVRGPVGESVLSASPRLGRVACAWKEGAGTCSSTAAGTSTVRTEELFRQLREQPPHDACG